LHGDNDKDYNNDYGDLPIVKIRNHHAAYIKYSKFEISRFTQAAVMLLFFSTAAGFLVFTTKKMTMMMMMMMMIMTVMLTSS